MFHDIDANKDTIYVCGFTLSNLLTDLNPQGCNPIIAAFDVESTELKWGFYDQSLSNWAYKIAVSPSGLYLVVFYDAGFLLTMHSSNGTVISGIKWTGYMNNTKPLNFMKQLLVNSAGDAAYALVYESGKSVFFRTNPRL